MNQYNISTEEITTVITLYSRIASQKKRIYAQGYLNGLAVNSFMDTLSNEKVEKKKSNSQQTA